MYRLVIFDVDGTLVRPKSGQEFRKQADDWEPLPGRKEKIAELQSNGVKIAFASNQGGVAFGYMSEQEILRALLDTAEVLDSGIGEPIHVLLCCNHPKAKIEKYRLDDPHRKPGPGMLFAAMHDACVNFNETLMVGDRSEDEEAARAASVDFQWARDYFASVVVPA